MLHVPVIFLVSGVVTPSPPAVPGALLGLFICFALAVAGAAFVFRWVEEPARTWINARFAGYRARSTPVARARTVSPPSSTSAPAHTRHPHLPASARSDTRVAALDDALSDTA